MTLTAGDHILLNVSICGLLMLLLENAHLMSDCHLWVIWSTFSNVQQPNVGLKLHFHSSHTVKWVCPLVCDFLSSSDHCASLPHNCTIASLISIALETDCITTNATALLSATRNETMQALMKIHELKSVSHASMKSQDDGPMWLFLLTSPKKDGGWRACPFAASLCVVIFSSHLFSWSKQHHFDGRHGFLIFSL